MTCVMRACRRACVHLWILHTVSLASNSVSISVLLLCDLSKVAPPGAVHSILSHRKLSTSDGLGETGIDDLSGQLSSQQGLNERSV